MLLMLPLKSTSQMTKTSLKTRKAKIGRLTTTEVNTVCLNLPKTDKEESTVEPTAISQKCNSISPSNFTFD